MTGFDLEALVARWVDLLRDDYPSTQAIMLKGSYARGDAGPHSDVDFDVLLDGPAHSAYPVRFEKSSERLRHISIAVQDLAGWLAEECEPEPWAFGLPVREPTRLLWAADASLRNQLDRPFKPHPPAEPELEDFVESFAKASNAHARRDGIGLRQAAQSTARYAPTLIRPLNPEAWADSPRSALATVLDFDIVPPGYREDMLMCLGMSDRAVTADDTPRRRRMPHSRRRDTPGDPHRGDRSASRRRPLRLPS